jgi:hypothetical protein
MNEQETTQIPVTWETAIVIPLVQNVVGGLAVGAFLAVLAFAWADANTLPVEQEQLIRWALIVGAAVCCAATFVRFFGDDVGLLTAAYHKGQRSRDAEVAALQLELRAALDAQKAVEVNGTKSATDKQQEMLQRAKRDAMKIVEVAFNGDSISRAAMAGRGMGRWDWERANQLLRAAGAMDGDGNITTRTPAQAQQAVDQRLTTDQNLAQEGTFTTRW